MILKRHTRSTSFLYRSISRRQDGIFIELTVMKQYVGKSCSATFAAKVSSSIQRRPCRDDEEDVGGDQARSGNDNLCNKVHFIKDIFGPAFPAACAPLRLSQLVSGSCSWVRTHCFPREIGVRSTGMQPITGMFAASIPKWYAICGMKSVSRKRNGQLDR